jgi:DNA-directed RNA polymerase II subunit RPB11
MSNTSDFIMLKEDHTLGNLIAEHLKAAPHVMMAGYKSRTISSRNFLALHSNDYPVAHPNVPEVLLRIQTDGSITPREALVEACKQLVAAYGQLGREFQKEYAFRQIADQGEQANANGLNGHH